MKEGLNREVENEVGFKLGQVRIRQILNKFYSVFTFSSKKTNIIIVNSFFQERYTIMTSLDDARVVNVDSALLQRLDYPGVNNKYIGK